MTISAWKLDGNLARLHSDRLSAALDLSRPRHGVFDFRMPTGHIESVNVMGIAMPSRMTGDVASPQDAFVRSTDLTATYQASEDRPVRVDAVWKATIPSSSHELDVAIDLLVSVRTDLLESRPQMAVQSAIAAEEIVSIADGCMIFRLARSDLSYIEMVHPMDSRGDELSGGGNTPFRIRHHLFDDSLEKGVVLRARLRGILLPRSRDTQLAADHFAAFRAAEPPLGA